MTRVSAANNRARGKQDEKDVAELFGGTRYWANSGGPCDVDHPRYAIQVKGGVRVLNNTIRDGVAAACKAAGDSGKLPLCVVIDRAGTRLQRYVVIPAEAFLAHEKELTRD